MFAGGPIWTHTKSLRTVFALGTNLLDQSMLCIGSTSLAHRSPHWMPETIATYTCTHTIKHALCNKTQPMRQRWPAESGKGQEGIRLRFVIEQTMVVQGVWFRHFSIRLLDTCAVFPIHWFILFPYALTRRAETVPLHQAYASDTIKYPMYKDINWPNQLLLTCLLVVAPSNCSLAASVYVQEYIWDVHVLQCRGVCVCVSEFMHGGWQAVWACVYVCMCSVVWPLYEHVWMWVSSSM